MDAIDPVTLVVVQNGLQQVASEMDLTFERAKKKGLQVAFVGAYPEGTTDFSTILAKVRAANPDVLGGGTNVFEEMVAVIQQMKVLNVNPRMVGLTVVDLPKFYEILGRDAEFVYGAAQWLPQLVDIRAGGLIPIARQYPGAREFVESYKKEFPQADLSWISAARKLSSGMRQSTSEICEQPS